MTAEFNEFKQICMESNAEMGAALSSADTKGWLRPPPNERNGILGAFGTSLNDLRRFKSTRRGSLMLSVDSAPDKTYPSVKVDSCSIVGEFNDIKSLKVSAQAFYREDPSRKYADFVQWIYLINPDKSMKIFHDNELKEFKRYISNANIYSFSIYTNRLSPGVSFKVMSVENPGN
jgi:hypothetical protein